MNFDDMVAADLEACYNPNEFATAIEHIFTGESELISESLDVIYDEFTEVVLDDGSHNGVESIVPSFSIPLHKAVNISYQSSFVINSKKYGCLETPSKKDGTMIVYLKVKTDA